MIINKKDFIVYHGSYMEVPKIDLSKCEPAKDFGQGFYVTTDRNQAINFIRSSINKNKHFLGHSFNNGYLNLYRVSELESLSCFEFTETDENWLNCVVGHRNRKYAYLAEPWLNYEVLIGKIADDKTARTINAYMAGAYGKVGSKDAVKIAIHMFETERLRNQICFRSLKSLKHIKFLRSERI